MHDDPAAIIQGVAIFIGAITFTGFLLFGILAWCRRIEVDGERIRAAQVLNAHPQPVDIELGPIDPRSAGHLQARGAMEGSVPEIHVTHMAYNEEPHPLGYGHEREREYEPEWDHNHDHDHDHDHGHGIAMSSGYGLHVPVVVSHTPEGSEHDDLLHTPTANDSGHAVNTVHQ
ncbi:hypothetical protein F4808DRAFT_468691 [Astrocystis sublimbata]|nr:hypothetical protein F4808DRAFT_468691 [Astrocystis sublimbata]